MDDLILLLKEVHRQLFQARSYKKKSFIHLLSKKDDKRSPIGRKSKRQPSHNCQKKRKRKGDLVIGFKRREKSRTKKVENWKGGLVTSSKRRGKICQDEILEIWKTSMKAHSYNKSMKRKAEKFNHNKDLSTNSNQRRKFESSKKSCLRRIQGKQAWYNIDTNDPWWPVSRWQEWWEYQHNVKKGRNKKILLMPNFSVLHTWGEYLQGILSLFIPFLS